MSHETLNNEVEKLTSIKCRMGALSDAIRKKSDKIYQDLVKVRGMFQSNERTARMAPEELTELIRTKIVKAYDKLAVIQKEIGDLKNTHNELHNVIVEFETLVVNEVLL